MQVATLTHSDPKLPHYKQLAAVPAELLQKIFGFLKVYDLVNAQSVCKSWRAVVQGQQLLKERIQFNKDVMTHFQGCRFQPKELYNLLVEQHCECFSKSPNADEEEIWIPRWHPAALLSDIVRRHVIKCLPRTAEGFENTIFSMIQHAKLGQKTFVLKWLAHLEKDWHNSPGKYLQFETRTLPLLMHCYCDLGKAQDFLTLLERQGGVDLIKHFLESTTGNDRLLQECSFERLEEIKRQIPDASSIRLMIDCTLVLRYLEIGNFEIAKEVLCELVIALQDEQLDHLICRTGLAFLKEKRPTEAAEVFQLCAAYSNLSKFHLIYSDFLAGQKSFEDLKEYLQTLPANNTSDIVSFLIDTEAVTDKTALLELMFLQDKGVFCLMPYCIILNKLGRSDVLQDATARIIEDAKKVGSVGNWHAYHIITFAIGFVDHGLVDIARQFLGVARGLLNENGTNAVSLEAMAVLRAKLGDFEEAYRLLDECRRLGKPNMKGFATWIEKRHAALF